MHCVNAATIDTATDRIRALPLTEVHDGIINEFYKGQPHNR